MNQQDRKELEHYNELMHKQEQYDKGLDHGHDPHYNTNHNISKLRAIHDRIVVEQLDTGERTTKAGVIIMDDQAKNRGIRPRWGKVYAIGPKQKEVNVGQWVLVDHARWTRGLKITDAEGVVREIRMVEPESVFMVKDTKPEPYDM